MTMVSGLAYEEWRTGGPPFLRWRDLTYLAGVLALLVTVAAVGGERWRLAFFAGCLGVGALAWYLQRSWHDLDRATRIERVTLPLIALLAFSSAAYGLMSWRWSLVGDEYDFFNLARSILDGTSLQNILSGTGVHNRHPVLSSYWQALSMKLFGVNSYGWRVASPLVLGLSVLPLYYFVRESSSRLTALISAAVFAGSHYLMTYAKIGYISVQAITPLTLALGTFALARRRGSILGFFLVGMAVGGGFYTLALSRLSVFPVAVLFLVYYPPHRKRSWYVYAITALGFALVVFPVVLDYQAWQGQASKSILQSEVANTLGGRLIQARNNVFYGAVAFMANMRYSHFIFGAHLDPISGILFLLGLGVVVQHLLTSHIHLAWFLSYAVLLVTTTGLQPYSYPSNTWLWFNLPIYAGFIGVGCHALAQVVADLAGRPRLMYVVASALVVVILPLNFWLSVGLSQDKTAKQSLAFILQSAQSIADREGRGPILHVIARQDFHQPLMSYMFRVYEIPWERFALHQHPADVEATITQLCDAPDVPSILLVSQTYPSRDIVKRRMEACWPEAREQVLVDGTGIRHFVRFVTPSALSQVRDKALAGFPDVTPEPSPIVMGAAEIKRQPWEIHEPRDVAVATDGRVAAIEGETGQVILLDSDGETILALEARLKDPSAIGFDPEGLLVVLDSGEGDAVVYFTLDGRVQRRVGSAAGFYSPRGLEVACGRHRRGTGGSSNLFGPSPHSVPGRRRFVAADWCSCPSRWPSSRGRPCQSRTVHDRWKRSSIVESSSGTVEYHRSTEGSIVKRRLAGRQRSGPGADLTCQPGGSCARKVGRLGTTHRGSGR
ncbi:MAG: glycosyltransferase family 39 protein [Dehalococcoidia bacterium]